MSEQVLSQAEIDELHRTLDLSLDEAIYGEVRGQLENIRSYLAPSSKVYRHTDGRYFIKASDIPNGYCEVGHMILCTDNGLNAK